MGEFAQYGDAFATRNHERQPSMPSSNLNAILRALPSVEEVLNAPEIKRLEKKPPRTVLTDAVRDELQRRTSDHHRVVRRATDARRSSPRAPRVGPWLF